MQAEEKQRAARQAADTQLASTQQQLEEAQRAQQRAQEQQHNAEEVLSVKLALLQSMAQRFAQAGEAKRKAAELQVKAQERIAQADEDMRALGQQLMYAAAGKLESNSDSRTAVQGETSGGAAATQGEGQADPNAPMNEHEHDGAADHPATDAPGNTAAQPQNSPTLQLQLNRSNTQHTVQGGLPVIEDTQENQPEPTAAPEAEDNVAVTANAAERNSSGSASASGSAATSASTSPSVQSSSKGPDGDENVNNNSMDVDTANTAQAVQKPDRASVVTKRAGTEQAVGVDTVANNASFPLQLPETAVYGQNLENTTLDEFDGME